MRTFTGERTKIERRLKEEGWELVSEYYFQGVSKLNYKKGNYAIHLEFGQINDVFGEKE